MDILDIAIAKQLAAKGSVQANQGSENEGKFLGISGDGSVVPVSGDPSSVTAGDVTYNGSTNYSSGTVGETLKETAADVSQLKSEMSDLDDDISELQNGLSYTEIITPLTITSDTKSIKNDGTFVNAGGYSLRVDVTDYRIVRFMANNYMTNPSNPYPVTAFTNENGIILKSTVAGTYTNGGTYSEDVPPSAKYFYINTWTTNGTISGIERTYSIPDTINTATTPIENNIISNNLYPFSWTNRIYYWTVGTRGVDSTRIGLSGILQAKSNLKFTAASGYNLALLIFSSSTESVSNEVRTSGWTTEAIAYDGEYFLINVKKIDNTNVSPSDSYNIVCSQTNVSNGTVIGADGIAKNVLVKKIGVLTEFQSFCVYAGNYYSTDGDNISKQDSDFNAISTTAISVGHGNGFQLGSSNKAYISGWNDQKIYVVNMDNITLDGTITLPTTGYTTAVIDDVNQIAYIFQRDSYPSTVVNYNFIVYDYANEQVLSTKRLTNAFGAMQAADFYCGRIYVVYGTGTSTLPSGFVVYDTNGNVLAEFNLDSFTSLEPEGICFDRDSKTLLVSDVNKGVYTVKSSL